MLKDSKDHIKSTKETYYQHLKTAINIGFIMIIGGLQAIIHAVIPAILTKSASEKIKKLYKIVSERS